MSSDTSAGFGVAFHLNGQAAIANVSLGVGALGLAAGGLLFFWPTSKEKARAAPTDRARVTVAPTLGGAVLSGRF